MNAVKKVLLAVVAVGGGVAGCGPLPAADGPKPAAPAASPPAAPKPPAATVAVSTTVNAEPPLWADSFAEGEAVKGDLEQSDSEVQRGLSALAAAVKDFEADRRKWLALDHSVQAARTVNAALANRNKMILDLYDAQLAGALSRFRDRLKAAPAVYRRMGSTRRRQASESQLELEKKNLAIMADVCEAAAVLCEDRYRELFADTGPAKVAGLESTIVNMRRYAVLHRHWAEVLDAFPSALEDRATADLFDHLSTYAEDFVAFTAGVERLKDAMKRKARPAEPDDGGAGVSPSKSGVVLARGTPVKAVVADTSPRRKAEPPRPAWEAVSPVLQRANATAVEYRDRLPPQGSEKTLYILPGTRPPDVRRWDNVFYYGDFVNP